MKKKTITLLAIIATINLNAQLCFSPAAYYPGNAARTVGAADFNNDGKQDIVTPLWASTVSVRLNTGAGTFGSSSTFTVGAAPSGVICADFNKDGNADIATANYNSNDASVLLGNGLGGFAAVVNYAVGTNPLELLSADFNGDGNADIAVTNGPVSGPGSISILIGNGTGTFATAVNYTTGIRPQDIFCSDFDKDGKLDLATANRGSNNVGIIFGTGTGSFGSSTTVMTGTLMNSPISIAGGDFNADGNIDLVVSNYNVSDVSVALGTGTGSFGAITNYTVGTSPYGVIVLDVDMDGYYDIVTADASPSTLSVLRGNGTGSFATAVSFAMQKPINVISADFDGDGKPDLAANSQTNSVTGVLLNCMITSVLENNEKNELSIYPNPSNGRFNLSRQGSPVTVEVYTATGDKILKRIISEENEIDLSTYGTGIYFLKILNEGKITTKKIIIE